MIPREALLREIGLPNEQFEVLVCILWPDKGPYMSSSPELSEQVAAVLIAGVLLYQYASPEQAIRLMQQVSLQELAGRDALVFSVINRVWFAVGNDVCWHIPSGRLEEELRIPEVMESHAIDALAVFKYVLVSATSSSARAEQIREILARRELRPDPQDAPDDTEPPAPDRQESAPPQTEG